MDGRRRKGSGRQAQEWFEPSRFEELDTEDSDEDGVAIRGQGFASDQLQFTGYDLARGMRSRQAAAFDDGTYAEGFGDREEYDSEYEQRSIEWQAAMKEKEDALVDRAERRMYRARIRGESTVQLTREELDALERKRVRHEEKALIKSSKSSQSKALTVAKPKRRQGGFLGLGAASQPSSSKSRKSSSKKGGSTRGTSSPTSSGAASPELSLLADPSSGPLAHYSPHAMRGAQSPSKRSSRQCSSSTLRQAATPPSGYYDAQVQRHASNPDSSRPHSSSSRGSPPPRSFPDDPNWQPRPRSSSSAHMYGNDVFAYQTGGPQAYSPNRRHVSGPTNVSYAAIRRVPVPQPAAGPRIVHSGSDPALLRRSSSGLSKEIVEISSDDDEEDEDEDDEEEDEQGEEEDEQDEEEEEDEDASESDEGVRVDVVPDASASGYGINVSRPSGTTSRNRRRGRR